MNILKQAPPGVIYEPIDPAIAPLVDELRVDPHIVTLGSCSGHGRWPAYVELAVQWPYGMYSFVRRLNMLGRELKADVLSSVVLNWSDEVATAIDFDLYPTWIMLTWQIESTSRRRAPSVALLKRIATTWEDYGQRNRL